MVLTIDKLFLWWYKKKRGLKPLCSRPLKKSGDSQLIWFYKFFHKLTSLIFAGRATVFFIVFVKVVLNQNNNF